MAHIVNDWTQGSLGATVEERKEESGVASTGVQKTTNRLHAKFTCPLCNDLFVDPVTAVRCGHIFCLYCYYRWVVSRGVNRSPYPCAVCSIPFVHLAPEWTMNDLVGFHMETLEANKTPGWYGPSPEMKTAYESRVTTWNAKKAGVREYFTHPEELIALVPLGVVKRFR